MDFYSNILSYIATISPLFMSRFFHSCFFCRNICILSHSSLGSDVENIVECHEAMIAGDLSNFLKNSSLLLFRPFCLIINFIPFPNSYITFLSCGSQWLTLNLLIVNVFKRSPSNLKDFLVSQKVNVMLYRRTGFLVFIRKSFILIELRSFSNLN